MKKVISILLIVAVISVGVIVSSCSSNIKLDGTYETEYFGQVHGVGGIGQLTMKVEFLKDNTCTVYVVNKTDKFEIPRVYNATYIIENGKLEIVSEEDLILEGEFVKNGKNFTVKSGDQTLVFEKK